MFPSAPPWHSATWNTYFSFQSQDEGSALDVTMWEELEDLVLECVLPMAVVLSFSALKASIFLILLWNSGPPRADIRNWMLQNPSGSGWLFLSLPLKGLHIYIWQFLLWPEIALLRPKVSNPDNYTVTTQQGDIQFESSAWSLLHLIFWGVAFLGPGARCPPIGPCPLD